MKFFKVIASATVFYSCTCLWSQEKPWWASFGDETLNGLVKTVFENNGDYAAMGQKLREAEARAQRAQSLLYPLFSITGMYNYSDYDAPSQPSGASGPTTGLALSKPGNTGSTPNTMATGGIYFNARYAPDVWGHGRQRAVASKFSAKASKKDIESLALKLGSRVVQTYFDVVYTQSLIKITERQIKSARDILEMARSRFRSGQYTLLPVLQQEQALAQAQTQLPPGRSNLRKGLEQLRILTGVAIKNIAVGDSLPKPDKITQLNADKTVNSHPDISAIRLRLEAGKHLEKAARWERFPSIELTGQTGYNYSDLSGDDQPTDTWKLGASLSFPLFAGFGKQAGIKEAIAGRQAMAYTLKQAARQTYSDIEFSLQQESDKRDELTAHLKNQEAAAKAHNEAKERFRQGLAEYMDVLSTQNALFMAEKSVLRAKLALLLARLQTVQAAGGNI